MRHRTNPGGASVELVADQVIGCLSTGENWTLEVHLINLVEDGHYGLLYDLVFQRR
jgi:hypothetical protein